MQGYEKIGEKGSVQINLFYICHDIWQPLSPAGDTLKNLLLSLTDFFFQRIKKLAFITIHNLNLGLKLSFAGMLF